MKPFLILSIVSFMIITASWQKTEQFTGKTAQGTIFMEFLADSGYLTKMNGEKLLQALGMLPYSDKRGSYIKQTDTIGKYYRSAETGNYVCCVLDIQEKFDFETHVLVELKTKAKGKYSVIAKERYLHGNYACCWNNNYDGFNFNRNYFTLNSCGTGSGFCSTRVYFFKSVRPQNKSQSIPSSYWSSNETGIARLSSMKIVQGDSLYCLYTLVTAPWFGEDSLGPEEVETFTIDFSLKNGNFTCDEKLLERLQF